MALDFHTTGRSLAGPFSTAVASFALSVVAAGRAVDHYGPRRMAAAGGVLSGTGLTMTALAQQLIVLHIGFGLLFGLAYSSVVTWASTRTGSEWGSRRSVGVVVAAYAAGPIVAEPVGGRSAAQWGWRVTVLGGAAVVTAVTVLASRHLPGAAMAARATHPTNRVSDVPALAALWLLFLSATAPGLFAYATDLTAERGLDPRLGGVAVAAMGAGNLVGRLVADPLIERVGLRSALRVDLVLLCAALVALTSLSGMAAALLALVLLSLQYGALSALLPTAVRQVCDASRFGRLYGLVFSSWGLAGLLAPQLQDPAAAGATALLPWISVAAAAVVGGAVYERRLALQPF